MLNKQYFTYLMKSKKSAWLFYLAMYVIIACLQFVGQSHLGNYLKPFRISCMIMGGISVVMTYVLPIFLFSFIHRKKSCDMCLSLPISRKELLGTTILFSFVIVYVPFAIMTLLEYVVTCASVVSFIGYLQFVLFFGFGLAILLVVNSCIYLFANNILDGLIMICAYTFLPILLVVLESNARAVFSADTMSMNGMPLSVYLSVPAMVICNMYSLTERLPLAFDATNGTNFGEYFAYFFIGLILFGILACIGLKKQFVDRKAERAEQVSNDFFAYPFIINIFLLATLIVLATVAVSSNSFQTMIVMYVLLFVVYILSTCMYKRKIQISLKNILYYIITMMATLIVAVIVWQNKGFGYAYSYSLTDGDTLCYSYYQPVEDGMEDSTFLSFDFNLEIPVEEIHSSKYSEIIDLLETKRVDALNSYFENGEDYYTSNTLTVYSMNGTKSIHCYNYCLNESFTLEELKKINTLTQVNVSYETQNHEWVTVSLDDYLKGVN